MPPMGILPNAELAAALTHARENFVTNAPVITVEQVIAARKPKPGRRYCAAFQIIDEMKNMKQTLAACSVPPLRLLQ